MDEISLKALAKINLGLDVLGKREDGLSRSAYGHADDPSV